MTQEIIFEALEKNLYNAKLSKDTLKFCISKMAEDANLFSKKKTLDVQRGEIVTCNFGFGLYSENYGNLSVIILNSTGHNKYLVVPINFFGGHLNKGFCMNMRINIDLTFLNSNEKFNSKYAKAQPVLYLNRIQEVHVSRLCRKIGFVSKWFLNSIYERFYSYNYEKPSLNLVIAELLSPAVKCAKNDNSDSLDFQQFFQHVKISSDMKLLRNTFSKALVTENYSLTCLIPLLQEDNELSLSKHAINATLRNEFVTWFNSLFPNIFDDYYRISLSDVLKVFLKCYNELI